MPLALLLRDVFGLFAKATAAIQPWNQLVDLEARLVARARAAFLVRWFGPFIPLDGFHVRIGIENLAALRDRYLRVLAASDPRLLSTGPNLLEPLAGMTGTLLGSVMTAPNSLVLVEWIERRHRHWGVTVLMLLNFFTLGLLGMGLTLLGGSAGAAMLGVGFAFTPGTRAVQDFLGALARFAQPLREFWLAISGPRDRVRNPILREVLLLTDRLAVLFPFLMSTVAIFFTYIGPLLDPLYRQFELLKALGEAVAALARDLIASALDLLGGWFDPAVPTSLPARLDDLLSLLADGGTRLFARAREDLVAYPMRVTTALFASLVGFLRLARERLMAFALQVVTTSPPIRAFSELAERFQLVAKLWRAHPKTGILPTIARFVASKASGSGSGSSSGSTKPRFAMAPDWLLRFFAGDPALPLSAIPGMAATLEATGASSPFRGIGPPVLRVPGSVFADERARLDREIQAFQPDRSVPDALLAVHLDEARLRRQLFEVVERLLPDVASAHLSRLRPVFEAADRERFGTSTPVLPVRALAESDRLKPVVRELVVRVRGGGRPAVEEWTEGLRAALRTQPYTVPAG